MIKKAIIILVLISIFSILNIYLFNSALEFSKEFPFKRTLSGNTLITKIDTAGPCCKFMNKIIKIEDDVTDSNNIMEILNKYKDREALNITLLDTEGNIIFKRIPRGKNNDYLLFLIFLIMFGNIHYLWGSVVYLTRQNELRSKHYFFSSISLSLFYFATVDQFTFRHFFIGTIITILLIGFLSIHLGYILTNQRMNKYKSILILVFSFIIIFLFYKGIQESTINVILFIYLLFCLSLTILKLLYEIIRDKNPYVIWRHLTLILGIFIGSFFPALNIVFSSISDYSLPVCLFSGATLLFPIIVGNAFLRYNQYDFYGFKIFQLNDIKLLSYNIVTALLMSVLLFSLSSISTFTFYTVFNWLVSILIAIVILNFLHFLISINDRDYQNIDNYAFSAQKIFEFSSSPESLINKLNLVFHEIIEVSGAASLKLIMFFETKDKSNSNISNYIELLPKETDIYTFMSSNKGIIFKYALSRNSAVEEKIYDFLEERNYILAIPIIENKKIIGALMTGERFPKRFYTNADIHYLKTAGSQALQLIKNDCLYKDYILKKQYEKELDNASYVQMRLFPKVTLDRDRGMDISFYYRPYLRVIGDYFDFFRIDEDRTSIIIGDVSGHGLSTAMILSAVNGITHAMLLEVKAIEKTCDEINSFLNNTYKGIELITLFIGIFDRKTKLLEYVNAGHGAPLLIKKNEKKIRQIEGRTKILGADPDAKYTTSSINLEKDDELILYTDGAMEIYNEKTDSGINEEKFMQIITDNIDKDVDKKIIEIEKNIKYHSEAIKDDITIICVKIH